MAWDKGEPIEGILAPDLNDVIRVNNDALEAALNAWIRFETGGTQSGQPRQGSARVYFQDSVPTGRLDGEYFDSTDLGCIWIDSNSDPDNQVNILTAADGAGTETWTPISTEVIEVLLAAARVFAGTLGVTGDFAVNTDKFTVEAATGNVLVAGTLDVTGNIDPTTFETTNGGFLDEDDFASDAADKVSSQQAIAAYIAARVGHDGDGYVLRDIDGTPTKVYTKYLTGTLDGSSTTSVAHGCTVSKILAVNVICYDSDTEGYRVVEIKLGADANHAFSVYYTDTYIVIGGVGAHLQGQVYRIKIDYYL